jgi:hypothetical protein
VGACGEQAKTATSKAPAFESSSTKAGPDEVGMATMLASALADENVPKSVATIQPGQAVAGELSSSDNTLGDGSYFDAWTFDLSGEADVEITLSSNDFDSYLSLYSGSPGSLGEHLGSDDDGAGGLNAQLRGTIGAGTYTIMANSYGGGETGSYTLSFIASGQGASSGSTGSGGAAVLRDGATGSGSLDGSDPTLDDGSHYDEWTYTGRGGETVTVSLSSSSFDTYLLAFRGSSLAGGEYLDENDDYDGTNSQLQLVLPASGTYTFIVNSYSAGETGSYQISMSSGGASSSSSTSFGSGGDPTGKYALLVGIDDYPGTGSDLRGPVEDARIMYRALTERFGFDPANIVTLNDAQATRENIANGIIQHLGQAGPDGVAVFFYSGHGTQIGRNIGLTGALDPEPRGEGDEAIYIYGHSQESSVLLDEELGFLIETIDAGRALVVVDACHSGEITRGAGDAPQSKTVDINDPEIAENLRLPTNFIGTEVKAIDELTDMSLMFGDLAAIEQVFRQPRRHIMWSSSTEEQVSWTSGLGNNASLFTYYAGEALMNAPLSASFRDISGGVHDQTIAYTRDNGMTDQNPVMSGDNARMSLGEFFGVSR